MKAAIYKSIIILLFNWTHANTILFAQESHPLDGNSYGVVLNKRSGGITMTAWKRDIFAFESGKFLPTKMYNKEGFGKAEYSASSMANDEQVKVNFTYKNSNSHGASLQIDGTVQGNLIKGTVLWTIRGKSHKYTFRGEMLS